MILRRRRLPHLHIIGQPLFVTFCLKDSLAANRRFSGGILTSGQAFLAMDRLLDQARNGDRFLARQEIARLVRDSIQHGAMIGHYELHSWAIMPNHVHLLLTPMVSASQFLGALKGVTAKRANALLSRSEKTFWQDESYDHLVRNEIEFRRIHRYIENNPVRAGLCATPEEYAWSSSWRAGGPPQARRLPHNKP